MKFYPADHLSDVPLKACSAAAQGLWISILCIRHSGKPTGHLAVNGRPMSNAMLAAQTGVPLKDVVRLVAELEAAGVFSRQPDGTIYSRRMIRDEEKATRDKANGKAGGNPGLKARHNRGVNPGVGRGDKAHSLWPLQEEEISKVEGGGSRAPGPECFDDAAPFGRGQH
jgi:hypothetical protein